MLFWGVLFAICSSFVRNSEPPRETIPHLCDSADSVGRLSGGTSGRQAAAD